MFNIVEFTKTVHGEFPNIGTPCTLIRVAECNLHCDYCDAQGIMRGPSTPMGYDEILWQLKNMTTVKDVLITGGEPMSYETRMLSLLADLIAKQYHVVLETNGTFDLSNIPDKVQISMDLKLTEEAKAYFPTVRSNLKCLGRGDILKVVLTSDDDTTKALDWLKSTLTYPVPFHVVFSSTPEYKLPVERLLEYQEAYPLVHIRLQAQLHKVWEVA